MRTSVIGLATAAVIVAAAVPAAAKDYLLTAAKPDKLVLIDAAARKVEKVISIPGRGATPATVVPSPDGKTAYVLTNQLESVSGIDLDSGKEVFRADMSDPKTRVKGLMAMDISADGKELYVFQSPVSLGLGEYKVMDTRIAVYDTSHGVGAEPVRMLPAPRRIAVLAAARDGASIWALGWDLYRIDAKTGEIKETVPLVNWKREDFSPADILDFWPQYEQAMTFSTPYFTANTKLSPEDPAAYKTGMLTLDLKNGKVVMNDFEDTSAIIFSTVVNPVRPNEAFGIYTQLSKIDMAKNELVNRVEMPHTYYNINISSDGREIYAGGTMCDISVHSTDSLDQIANIKIPDCPDMGVSSLRVVKR